jgi:hypothetical protein
MRGETVKNGDFSDSEENAIDAIVLQIQSTSNFPSWHTRLRRAVPLVRIKALHANTLSCFRLNSVCFKLQSFFDKM